MRGSCTWKYKGNDLRKGGLKRGVLSHWWFHRILAQVDDAELICQVKKDTEGLLCSNMWTKWSKLYRYVNLSLTVHFEQLIVFH